MIHRAVTLALLIAVSILLLVAMLVSGLHSLGWGSLAALAILVVAAAVAGVALSWRRYAVRTPRR